MAKIVAGASGDIAGAVWDSVTNTPTLHATTNITPSTVASFSATFTAPNTTNACKGVLLYMATGPSATRTITITLQESGVDTAATIGISLPTTLVSGANWCYFQFPTPYVFTTTAAGAYRFKMVSSVSSSNATFGADSGGANFAYLAVDNRPATFGGSDEVFIVGPNFTQTTSYTITNTGTNTLGNNLDTSTSPTIRSLGNALYCMWGGTLAMDTTATNNLTIKGHAYLYYDGEMTIGSVSTPVSSSAVATVTMSAAAASAAQIVMGNRGKFKLQGAPKTNWKSTYVSGLGTAASPMITAGDIGEVGDEVVVGTTDTYNHNEYKFIITKNSSTSYVLSNTSGGVEAALSFTHNAGAHVVNLQRNAVVRGTSTTLLQVFGNTAVTNAGYVDMDWGRFERFSTVTVFSGANVTGTMDYCVNYENSSGIAFATSKLTGTFTGLVSAKHLGTTSGSAVGHFRIVTAANNKTFTDCFAIGGNFAGLLRGGFTIGSYNITLNNCHALGAFNRPSALTSFGEAGFGFASAGSVTLNNCTAIGNTQGSVGLNNATDIVFNNFTSGGTDPVADVYTLTDSYNTALFNDSSFVFPAAPVTNYLSAITGTLIRFHNVQTTDNRHLWNTVNGVGTSTGTGLPDTTVRSGGSLAVRLAPDTSEGLRHIFKILAKPDTFVSVNGFVRMNSTFTGDASTVLTAELYLPGSLTADATQTITKTADTWLAYNIGAVYSGDVTEYATVYIRASNPNAVAGAYAYHDDIYNGTNPITALDVWDEGQPSPIAFEQLGDAAAVWAVSTAGLTTDGTTGKQLTKALTTGKFLGLK